jgi:TRAP-type C4-dicarboxylate transport system permease small subunit
MLLKILDRLEEILISFLMAAATLIIFVAVCHRYGISGVAGLIGWGRAHDMMWLSNAARSTFRVLADINLTWAQEACIYLFVWMAKFGAAYGVRTGIHVGVDVLVNRLRPDFQRVMIMVALGAGALFTVIVGTLGARFVLHMAATDQTSADLEMPMWIVYLAVPLGSYLMCFRFLQEMWRFWTTGEVAKHDPAHVEIEGLDGKTDLAASVEGRA